MKYLSIALAIEVALKSNEQIMIDKDNKLILVHLPKTGGTSGAAALRSGEKRKTNTSTGGCVIIESACPISMNTTALDL